MIDYKELLIKFMIMVMREEGTRFLYGLEFNETNEPEHDELVDLWEAVVRGSNK